MSRTSWRVMRTELLRGTAPVAALALGVTGAPLLFNETESWAGRWGPLAEYVRVLLLVLVPLAVASGAWQGGRERRRGTGELVGSGARPSWQPVVVAWVAVTLGTFGGLFVVWLSGAVLVAPVATYAGRGWWWTLAVAFVALGVASALGVSVGRLVPSRVVASLAGLATYVGLGILTYGSGGSSWLAPNIGYSTDGGQYLELDFQLLQAIWLGGLAATLLALTAARRKGLALLPAAVAVVAAVPIVTGPGYDRWQNDPQARELVCANGSPEVCMTRVNAFLLEDATPVVRAGLERWEGVDGGFVRAIDGAWRDERADALPPDGTAELHLDQLISWRGGLSEVTEYGDTLAHQFARAAEDAIHRGCGPDGEGDESLWHAMEVAFYWVGGDPTPTGVVPGPEGTNFGRLLAMPEADQKAWMSRYMAAARSCDEAAFAELLDELR